MAPSPSSKKAGAPPLTRTDSSDSTSALSNIDVSRALQAAAADSSSISSSQEQHERVDTPPTSLAETGSQEGGGGGSGRRPGRAAKLERIESGAMDDAEEAGTRSRRARAGVGTYNLKKLSDAQQPLDETNDAGATGRRRRVTTGSSRNVSGLTGRTLVYGQEEEDGSEGSGTPFAGKVEKSLDLDWELPEDIATDGKTASSAAGKVQRRPSMKERVKKGLVRAGSVLGKRGREVLGGGKAKRQVKASPSPAAEDEEEEDEEDLPRWKKQLDTGTKGVLDELDLDAEPADIPRPPTKKQRVSGKAGKAPLRDMPQPPAAPIPTTKPLAAGKKMKKWQKEGLYVGQDPDMDPAAVPNSKKKLQKKSRPSSSTSDVLSEASQARKRHLLLPLPMFSYLEKTRDFTIPFDIFAPSFRKGDAKPRDWHQLNKNRLVGEAKELWEVTQKNLPQSLCVCAPPGPGGEQGCDEVCLNRVMQYECNTGNCNLSEGECSNRAFSELTKRLKRGGAYDIGVEVVQTANRGFGVRSCRTFAPGQIIMEYTGEIITEMECQRRMREVYQDKSCYYLMELERGLIIDGTKGSMARFINHSCEPNCEVRMVKVNGTPRMGVFAGENGVNTGEELAYDYNFDNFGASHQVCYCGAPSCRGFLSKRLNKEEMKKAAREEMERKSKAEAEAARHAAEEARKKVVKNDRGSGWRGWLSIDDPETKERLRREKKEREEAEKNSSRAMRLAKRHGGPGAAETAEKSAEKASPKRRRKTMEASHDEGTKAELSAVTAKDSGAAAEAEEEVTSSPKRRKVSHTRTISSAGSGFRERLSTEALLEDKERSRPSSAHNSAITRKTEVSISREPARHADGITPATDEEDTITVEHTPGGKRKRPFHDAAKTLGQAVKSGLGLQNHHGNSSGEDGQAGKRKLGLQRSGSVQTGAGTGKLKQSTLSFGRRA